MLRRVLLIALGFIPPACSGAPVDPQALFNRIRLHVADSMRNANSYTCVETINRDWYAQKYHMRPVCDVDRLTEPRNLILFKNDRLRLDVGIVQGQEVFSWHGESRFKTEKIDDLVTDGPIHSGTFFSLLSSIFVSGHGRYFYRGMRRRDAGGDEAVFTFRMSRSASRFTLDTPDGAVVMSYDGTFTADALSGLLTGLQVLTDDFPKAAHVCSLRLTAGYSQNKNEQRFNAPSQVELEIFDQNTDIIRTSTQYLHCHQFTGLATIHFDGGYDSSAATPASLPVREVPAGRPVKIRLTSAIDSASAWAGDPVEGELAAAITTKKGEHLIEKGTRVSGRLLGCAHVLEPREYWTLNLRFDTIHTPKAEYRVALKPKPRVTLPDWASSQFFPPGPRNREEMFQFTGDKFRLDGHFESEWVTMPVPRQN